MESVLASSHKLVQINTVCLRLFGLGCAAKMYNAATWGTTTVVAVVWPFVLTSKSSLQQAAQATQEK